MATYTMADAENLLGVKAHVIRYWEQEISILHSELMELYLSLKKGRK